MNALPHRPSRLRATSWTALACALLVQGHAHAQVGPCFVRSGRPFLLGFSFHVADLQEVEAWADRFGFGPLEPASGTGGMRTRRLRQGFVWWSSRPIEPFEDLDTHVGTPVSDHRLGWYGAPEPPDEPSVYDVPTPPNGALRPIRAIAVMKDLPRLLEAFTFRHSRWNEEHNQYGGSFPAPQVGALAHDLRYDSGSYRFLFATDSTGLAANWLSQGSRWIGAAFEVADADSTERALAARGVPTVRVREPIGDAVWVLPEVAGGTLLEFVQLRR